METPEALRAVDQQTVAVREYEYDDGTVIVVDFGRTIDDLSVDIVDETAIVVVDDQQIEFEVPSGANEVIANDGILTIEGSE